MKFCANQRRKEAVLCVCRSWEDWLDSCKLIDLGFSGSSFTWTNKRFGKANIKERLDRLLCNQSWRHLFEEAIVTHLPRTHSDHHPIIIDLEGSPPPPHNRRPFPKG